jgi:excisionase family DNA binding protein
VADLTAGPEQSAGGAGRTYRHRQRTRTARDTAPATPADEPAPAPDALLTLNEVITELRVSRAAFYRWRRRGTGPAEVRLPGGGVRIRRSALQAWLRRREQPQQEDTPA